MIDTLENVDSPTIEQVNQVLTACYVSKNVEAFKKAIECTPMSYEWYRLFEAPWGTRVYWILQKAKAEAAEGREPSPELKKAFDIGI